VPGCGVCFGIAAAHEVHPQRSARPARRAQLQLVAAARPHGVRRALAGAGVGRVVAADGEPDPWAPAPAVAPHPDLEAQRACTPHAEQVEAPRRAQHPARGSVEVGRPHVHPEAAQAAGDGASERGQRSGEQRSHAGCRTEDEGAPTRDRRGTHRGESTSAILARNPCTMSCHP
jgi:hypothetical protein